MKYTCWINIAKWNDPKAHIREIGKAPKPLLETKFLNSSLKIAMKLNSNDIKSKKTSNNLKPTLH